MLDKMMETQQRRFLTEGGIREVMTRARLQNRSGNYPNPGNPPENPPKPKS